MPKPQFKCRTTISVKFPKGTRTLSTLWLPKEDYQEEAVVEWSFSLLGLEEDKKDMDVGFAFQSR